jgi:hypothetical protein
MNVGKALAAAFCAAVLGGQTFAIVRSAGGDQARYWPFLSYPMYAPAHRQGDQIRTARLVVTPCDSTADTVARTSTQLRVPQYRFRELLLRGATAHPAAAAGAAERLRQQLRHHEPRAMCRMAILVESYTIGRNGLELPGSPWRLARAWVLTDSAAVLASDSSAVGSWR